MQHKPSCEVTWIGGAHCTCGAANAAVKEENVKARLTCKSCGWVHEPHEIESETPMTVEEATLIVMAPGRRRRFRRASRFLKNHAEAVEAADIVVNELARLRARCAELEAENTKLEDGLDAEREFNDAVELQRADPLASAKDAVCEAAEALCNPPHTVQHDGERIRALNRAVDALAAHRGEQGEKE